MEVSHAYYTLYDPEIHAGRQDDSLMTLNPAVFVVNYRTILLENMEAFKTTLLGQFLRKIWPHSALLYNDEQAFYDLKLEKTSSTGQVLTVIELSW